MSPPDKNGPPGAPPPGRASEKPDRHHSAALDAEGSAPSAVPVQLGLDLGLPENVRAVRTDLPDRATWWQNAAAGIGLLADAGIVFDATDLRRRIGDPPHPNLIGPAFSDAHRRGVIVPVARMKSRRRAVKGSLDHRWVGACPVAGEAS